MRLKRSISGDTIVEVMLAIAVTSAVLAGAFVAVNRSLKAARSAQERGEAIKVAEAQIERLKYLSVEGDNAATLLSNGPYCINSALEVITVTDVSNGEADPVGCKSSGRYVASITRSGTVHEIRVLWENVTGSNTVASYPGFDEIKMYYRVYE